VTYLRTLNKDFMVFMFN